VTDANSRPGRVAVLGGGFIGLLRPELYERMLAALPPGVLRTNQSVERIERGDRHVTLRFADGSAQEADVLIGADGINSLARRTLWGDTPIREHRLHVIGGFTFADDTGAEPGMAIIATGGPSRAAGRPSGTKARTATSGGFLRPAIRTRPRPRTCWRTPRSWAPRSRTRCQGSSTRPAPGTSSAG
jgi:2-polyprenyl-6-methoxyphenol hydroxylase-like FAD-dependent oxidoreductase